jgi:hypothetical protein
VIRIFDRVYTRFTGAGSSAAPLFTSLHIAIRKGFNLQHKATVETLKEWALRAVG